MNTPWKPVLQGVIAAQAITIATEVAQRSSSPVNLLQAFENRASGNPATFWHPISIGSGNAGIALLAAHMHRCFPEQGWDAAVHYHLSRAVATYDYRRPNASLYAGVSSLGFATMYASRNNERYGGLHQRLTAYLAQQVPAFLHRANHEQGLSIKTFDLISGVAGIVTYLVSLPRAILEPELVGVCERMLEYLISLAEPNAENGLYGFIKPDNISGDDRVKLHPHGYSDLGLAHGVAGIVGALAIALHEGWDAPGVRDGLSSLAHWLSSQQLEDGSGINWPTFREPSARKTAGARAAWCYGIPGIARALYLAGEALQDTYLERTAVCAFEGIILRPRKEWGIISPNLCHGLSGILQSSVRMYHNTGSPSLRAFIERVTQEIVSLYNPDSLFGFQDKYAHYDWFDTPRLLEGAPGVALALLAASLPIAPDWDRMLLLS